MAIEKGLNCCLFAVSKMYVCTTNESCPSLHSRFGAMAKPSEVDLIKTFYHGRRKRESVKVDQDPP